MPLPARTPREAFQTFQDHLNRTLNKVLTRSRLRFFIRSVKQEKTTLAFFDGHSRPIDPDFPYSRHHVQCHREFQGVRDGFSPNTLHIPTGGVTIEHVIRFLIADLDVPPLVDKWDEELRKSEEQLRTWTGTRAHPREIQRERVSLARIRAHGEERVPSRC